MRTAATLQVIVERLQGNCGDLFDAAKNAGVSLVFLKQWMRDDKVVGEQIDEARRVGHMRLETAAIKRAVEGVDKAVYFKGEVVGYDRVYSDGLLSKLLEARVDGFQRGEAGTTINGGNVQINIMPRASSYDEWLLMKERTLNPPKQEALPAPEEELSGSVITHRGYGEDITEADFVPVSPFDGLGL